MRPIARKPSRVLDLLAVPEAARITTYPLSLFAATTAVATDRFFLGGTTEAYNSVLVNFDQE